MATLEITREIVVVISRLRIGHSQNVHRYMFTECYRYLYDECKKKSNQIFINYNYYYKFTTSYRYKIIISFVLPKISVFEITAVEFKNSDKNYENESVKNLKIKN